MTTSNGFTSTAALVCRCLLAVSCLGVVELQSAWASSGPASRAAHAAPRTPSQPTAEAPTRTPPATPSETDSLWKPQQSRDKVVYYEEPPRRDYLRLAILESLILGSGLGWYFYNHELNSKDFAYDYDFRAFEAKLTGEAYSFDNNRFDTNFLSHPGAGALYYLAARSSHFDPSESAAITFGMSVLWEYLAEYREYVSVNDMVVTPFAGIALGESLYQLGAFFDRSCPTPTNKVLGTIFGPLRSAGDALEDAQLLRSRYCDSYGLSSWGHHRFELSSGTGAARRFGTGGAHDVATVELTARSEIINLRHYGYRGTGWTSFDDGNVSWMDGSVRITNVGVDEVSLAAHALFAGLHYRDLAIAPRRGSETVIGIGTGAQYSRKRWHSPSSRLEPWFLVDLPTIWGRYRRHFRQGIVELSIMGAGTAGGVRAFAIEQLQRDGRDRSELPTVAYDHGYHHVVGAALAPSVRWSGESIDAGVAARFDRAAGIRALDDERVRTDVKITETRQVVRLWADIGRPQGLKLRLSSTWTARRGSLDETSAQRSELRAGAGLLWAL